MAEQQVKKTGFKSVVLFKDQTLGVGSYGAVYKAKCDGLVCAAKILHQTLYDPLAQQQVAPQRQHRLPMWRFEQECELLSSIRHPNIVLYLGMDRDRESGLPVLLMELMDESLTHFVDNSTQPIPHHIQVNICHDIALALSFLHYNKIVHRDLTSNNVLLRGNIIAKVTDFGMARLSEGNRGTTHLTKTAFPGADVYMPPEAVDERAAYTEKIDCFSFGVIVLQMLTRLFPKPGDRVETINDPRYPRAIQMRVREVERREEHIRKVDPNHPLLAVVLDCLKDEERERPSAEQLCERMAALKESGESKDASKRGQGGGGEQVQDSQEAATVQDQLAHYRNISAENTASTSASKSTEERTTECKGETSTPLQDVIKGSHMPILHYEQLECDHKGRELTIEDHDITLRIPEGALAEGEKVRFEVGVAMYGPFIFPENTQPISPILALCILEEDVELKKPFQVVMPHYLTGIPKERVQYHQVGFVKASHNDFTFIEDQMTFKFQKPESDAEPILLASSGSRNYAVLVSKHCCFYCLKAKQSEELDKDAGYCVTRIEHPQRNEIYFSVTYFLETCFRSLKEQFPPGTFQVSRTNEFKFKDGTKPLKITPTEHDQCVIAMEPTSAKIKPSEVDFWSKSFANMQLKHKRKMYPPRVKMTATLINPDIIIKLPVKFSGHVRDTELNVELTLPLGLPSAPSGKGSQNMEPQSHNIICEKPKLRDVFRKLLPLASRWKTIGLLLNIQKYVLDKIKSDEEGVEDRLQEMLSEWLKQVNPPPTWKDLAGAVDDIDEQKAKEIRDQCVDTYLKVTF